MSSLLRAHAEHEAAHAILAAHFGLKVVEIRLNPPATSYTLYESGGISLQQCAISAGGDLWAREFSALPYTDLACGDLIDIEREHGLSAIWGAERLARQVLAANSRAVLSLAERLTADRVITFEG
ncbi:hypothetical protein AB0F17_63455 [Nonomuraea sp. NPDC026600]|uniref:hypothetical protein n=1 Tax=Nonomuraea sp. NPDC026600 TaxID=3155363 RepID=UPI00340013C3